MTDSYFATYTTIPGLEPTQVSDAYRQATEWAIPVGIVFTGFCLAVLLVSFGLSKL